MPDRTPFVVRRDRSLTRWEQGRALNGHTPDPTRAQGPTRSVAIRPARCAICGAEREITACVQCGKALCERHVARYSNLSRGELRGDLCPDCVADGLTGETGPLHRPERVVNKVVAEVRTTRADVRRLALGARDYADHVLLPAVERLQRNVRLVVREGLWGTVDRVGWWVLVIVLAWLLFG